MLQDGCIRCPQSLTQQRNCRPVPVQGIFILLFAPQARLNAKEGFLRLGRQVVQAHAVVDAGWVRIVDVPASVNTVLNQHTKDETDQH